VGAIIEMLKGKNTVIYLVYALIMFFTSGLILSWINMDKTTIEMMTSGPPAYLLSFFIVGSFSWLLFSKRKQWKLGTKKPGKL